ncbi:acetyltransferase, GNAT family protein [Trichomonas vaginalis G3]|uniref:Acetyltransferase, GNAT family protein n=1 Tax=Trichomonas vaginalis (strain ATCC PRA-98 / G3) TaxID=412133 RepID=A2DVB5_TRIV3|nr:acetyltransferase (GNAT) family [Trichomonas vaginalis G3]EAY15594.1 acetyltransferase, GNAT family protein [Trichomonas vaginalis G3]KAI5530202.1 acetyltransferase (GNAT) family [Trichomonas vaginalis G3]|eukprot:XP_001327817.1 acetyltransferase, GNAT family protein [Trichomonas vaginalis G3]
MEFRLANESDKDKIWEILQQAIAQRKADGSNQWQDGYPNTETVANDIKNKYGYVLTENGIVIAYAAAIFDVEPAYNDLEGKWLTNGDYLVIHRIATHKSVKGRGLGTKILEMLEDIAVSKKIYSIKVDTNFDNKAMLHILDKLKYVYCGEVKYDGSPRLAFEKVLHSK